MRQSKLYLALASVCALMAVIPATSLAAQFEVSYNGYLEGYATSPQTFSFGEGKEVVCNEAVVNGMGSGPLYIVTKYAKCMWAGSSVPVEVSTGHYTDYANGQLDVQESVTLTVLIPIYKDCTITIKPQNGLSVLNYENVGNSLKVTQAVKGIEYSSEGQYFCPASGSNNGTLSGSEIISLPGGIIHWRP